MADDASSHPLITAGRVNDTPVFDRDGQRMGHVDDLSIDKVSGRVLHVLLSFGGFLGIGERFHVLPWSVLTYDAERQGYVISLDRSELERAPSYTRDDLERFGAGELPVPL